MSAYTAIFNARDSSINLPYPTSVPLAPTSPIRASPFTSASKLFTFLLQPAAGQLLLLLNREHQQAVPVGGYSSDPRDTSSGLTQWADHVGAPLALTRHNFWFTLICTEVISLM